MEIYKSKIDYLEFMGVSCVVILLSFIPCVYFWNSCYWCKVIMIVLDIILIYFLSRKEIKVVRFLSNQFEVYYPILGLRENYEYDSILKIIHTQYIPKVGKNLVIKLAVNGVEKRIVFKYYANGNKLLDFFNAKGFKISDGSVSENHF